MTRRLASLFLLVCLAPASGSSQPVTGQSAPPQPLTLDQAIQYAADHYPTLRAALEQASASAASVDIARAAYLPRLDAIWQSNRATVNNVVGQVLPQSVLPALSGPVFPAASSQSVWSSATGALLSWEAYDFGLRHATVAGAEAGLAQARAAEALTRIGVQRTVADAFLRVLASQRAVVAVEADLQRRQLLFHAVQVLVDNQLRPGVDASRAEAERAAAQIRVIQTQEALAVAQAALVQALGTPVQDLKIAGDALLDRLPPVDVPLAPAAAHPLARVRGAAVEQARAQESVLARTDLPRIFLQSSVFARGSGAGANGNLDGGGGGLGLDRANWAAGVQVVFPNLFDFARLGAVKAAAAAAERASAALYDEAILTVGSEQQAADAMLRSALAIASNTPVQLAAARLTEARARARYDAGLASIIEVADAQSLLAQAEVQDQLARVDTWRALLAASTARGDLGPFVDLVRQP
jgi:outer membrane protein